MLRASILTVSLLIASMPALAAEWVTLDGGKCLNMSGGMAADPRSYDDRKDLIAWPCSGAANENFELVDNRLRLAGTNWCVSTSNDNRHQGDPMILTKCLFGPSGDYWQRVESWTDGTLHQASGRCLNVEGGLGGAFLGAITGNQAQRIILWSCDNPGNNEKWNSGSYTTLRSVGNNQIFSIAGMKGSYALVNGSVYGVISHDGGTYTVLQKALGYLDANGNLISSDAGSVIAQGGGNVIAQGGGNVIAQGGGNLIGMDQAGVVGPGGSSLVSTNGGNLLANLTSLGNNASFAAVGLANAGPQVTPFANISGPTVYPLTSDAKALTTIIGACGDSPKTPLAQSSVYFAVGSNKYARITEVPPEKIAALAHTLIHGYVCYAQVASSWTHYTGPWSVPAAPVAAPPPPPASAPVAPAAPKVTQVHDLAPGSPSAFTITLASGETWHFNTADVRVAKQGSDAWAFTFRNAPGFTMQIASAGISTNLGAVSQVGMGSMQSTQTSGMKQLLDALLANASSTPFPVAAAAPAPASKPALTITNLHELAPGVAAAFTIVLSTGEAWHFSPNEIHVQQVMPGRYAVSFTNAPGFTATKSGTMYMTDRGNVAEVRYGALAAHDVAGIDSIFSRLVTLSAPKTAAPPAPAPPAVPQLLDARAVEGHFTPPKLPELNRNGLVTFSPAHKSDLPLIAFTQVNAVTANHRGDKNRICGEVAIMLDGKRFADRIPKSHLGQVVGFACTNDIVLAGGWTKENF